MPDIKKQHLLISRIDAIGDVTLTLPMCGYLKSVFPDIKLTFLGRSYTEPVIKACAAIDHFINFDQIQAMTSEDEKVRFLQSKSIDIVIHVLPKKHLAVLARLAGIPLRIGTTNRIYHWFNCNKLVKLSRKKSNLHEAQLNMVLLKGLGIKKLPQLNEIPSFYKFNHTVKLKKGISDLLSIDKFNLVLHPKSHGSGMEWPLEEFEKLINLLPSDKFNVLISGSTNETEILKQWILKLKTKVTDVTGMMDLSQFIAFLHHADGLVASGTGPLHLAAASGINVLGLFPATKPIHATRWAPLGLKADYLESNAGDLSSITAQHVFERINTWTK